MKAFSLRVFDRPLILLVGLNLLPGVGLRPWVFMGFALVLVIYRLWLDIENKPMPPRWMSLVIQAVIPVMVWQHYESLFGDEAAGTWLTLLMCLKLFELRAKRDYFVTAALCLMTLMGTLLLDQSLLLSLFLLLDVWLVMAFLHALEGEVWSWSLWRAPARRSGFLVLKSAPLLILIFILFPRFSTGFGTGGTSAGKTGITDQLKPGSIANLIPSDELIFRATFLDGLMPPRQSLYWRGAILDISTGLNWERSDDESGRRAPFSQGAQDEIEIYLEPGSQKFLFTLDSTRAIYLPGDPSGSRLRLREGGIFELSADVQSRERYFLESDAAERLDQSSDRDFERYLAVSRGPTRRMSDFISGYRGLSPVAVVAKLGQDLKAGGYSYSLSPPPVETVDEFLFETKTGFCEHYAGALATVLRHLGIPSRVVVGFQGGSPSFLENYITVRAYDAHAWIEYFDRAGNRWRRFDPTAMVEPARLVMGSTAISGRAWLPTWVPQNWLSTYLKGRAFVDEVEAAWIGFLVRFDLARQKELLAKLGMEAVLFRALPVFLVMGIILVLAVLYFLEAHGREPLTPEERLYRTFLRRLKRWRIEKGSNEGPMTLMTRIERADRSLARNAEPILTELTQARFGARPLDSTRIRELKRRINSLTP